MLYFAATTQGQVTVPHAIRQKMHKDIKAAFGLVKTEQSVTLAKMKKAIRKGATKVPD